MTSYRGSGVRVRGGRGSIGRGFAIEGLIFVHSNHFKILSHFELKNNTLLHVQNSNDSDDDYTLLRKKATEKHWWWK